MRIKIRCFEKGKNRAFGSLLFLMFFEGRGTIRMYVTIGSNTILNTHWDFDRRNDLFFLYSLVEEVFGNAN